MKNPVKNLIDNINLPMPSWWKYVVNVCVILGSIAGIALAGELSFEGQTIAWDLNDTWRTISQWTVVVCSILAGLGKTQRRKKKTP